MNTTYDLNPAYGQTETGARIGFAAAILGVVALVVAATGNPALFALTSVCAVIAVSTLAPRSTTARVAERHHA